jgi:hypothetical protein
MSSSVHVSEGRKIVLDWLHEERRCVLCELKFTEHDNLGKWLCTGYHPAENEERGPRGEYMCCGRRGTGKPKAPGCTRADHTTTKLTPFDEVNKLLIRPDAFMMLGNTVETPDGKHLIVAASWHHDESTGSYLVDRVDFETEKLRMNPLMRVNAPTFERADWRPLREDEE